MECFFERVIDTECFGSFFVTLKGFRLLEMMTPRPLSCGVDLSVFQVVSQIIYVNDEEE